MHYPTLNFDSLLDEMNESKPHKRLKISSDRACHRRGDGGWIVRPPDVDMMDFALNNLPSSGPWDFGPTCWINLRTYNETSNDKSTSHAYSGKWMWFVYNKDVDDRFIMLADALQNGLLGDSLKVPPVDCQVKEGQRESVSPFIIYTKDFRDRTDVLRVGLALRMLGAVGTISYKPDVFTLSEEGIHGRNELPKSIYNLKKGSSELFLTNRGQDYDSAVRMVEAEITTDT